MRFRVAVNLSARQFESDDLVPFVKNQMEKYHLPPGVIELEVTESMTMANLSHSIQVLNQLRETGATIAIDDFGTGHSSLQYLKDFPAKRLKIHHSFLEKAGHEENSDDLIRIILLIAKKLNLEVIAEGVETEEQRSFLLKQRCLLAQGFLFSPALPVSELEPIYESMIL